MQSHRKISTERKREIALKGKGQTVFFEVLSLYVLLIHREDNSVMNKMLNNWLYESSKDVSFSRAAAFNSPSGKSEAASVSRTRIK